MTTINAGSIFVVQQEDGVLCIDIPPEEREAFNKLISRGLNCWDHAPASIKALGDLVTNGRILQDYHSQDSSKADVSNKSNS